MQKYHQTPPFLVRHANDNEHIGYKKHLTDTKLEFGIQPFSFPLETCHAQTRTRLGRGSGSDGDVTPVGDLWHPSELTSDMKFPLIPARQFALPVLSYFRYGRRTNRAWICTGVDLIDQQRHVAALSLAAGFDIRSACSWNRIRLSNGQHCVRVSGDRPNGRNTVKPQHALLITTSDTHFEDICAFGKTASVVLNIPRVVVVRPVAAVVTGWLRTSRPVAVPVPTMQVPREEESVTCNDSGSPKTPPLAIVCHRGLP